MCNSVVLSIHIAEIVDSDESDKESEEEQRAMRELYEAIGYAEGEVYEFPREVRMLYISWQVCLPSTWQYVCYILLGSKIINTLVALLRDFNCISTCRGSFRKFLKGGVTTTYHKIRRGDGLVWDHNLVNCCIF